VTIKGISEGKAEKIVQEAIKLVPMGFSTAASFLEVRNKMICISTGSQVYMHIDNASIGTR
jgi:DNA repair protein RAD51